MYKNEIILFSVEKCKLHCIKMNEIVNKFFLPGDRFMLKRI